MIKVEATCICLTTNAGSYCGHNGCTVGVIFQCDGMMFSTAIPYVSCLYGCVRTGIGADYCQSSTTAPSGTMEGTEESSTMPGQGTTMPDYLGTNPDQGSTNPDQMTTIPDQETTNSDQGTTNPDQGTTNPN